MSGNHDILALKEDDVTKFLGAGVHIGAQNVDYQMMQYIYKRKSDGGFIINLRRTWEKLLLAARAIVAVENPADVCVISARPYGQRAVLKFAMATGATAIAGRFTPGTFTNQIQAAYREPRLLVVTDPRTDQQPITESSYVNIPVIALCNTDAPLRHIDIAIPCNNKGIHSIGLMWWMLAREVLRLRGTISREISWETMPDLYFYRDPEDAEKDEQDARERAQAKEEPAVNVGYPEQWGGQADAIQPVVDDWAAEATPAAAAPPPQQTGFGATSDWSTGGTADDWSAAPPEPNKTQDWAADSAKTQDWAAPTPSSDWGGAVSQDWTA
ncbi:40S ribosomal protein SA-like [Anneissia japonica]|uniref:40S ribosomal protein SA-like n=1 Tax=Anneissia japonica TaxID=1529436 RepID=UPI0014256C62|nr:40S ribosomal protein SA-like [Anneissia japonica]